MQNTTLDKRISQMALSTEQKIALSELATMDDRLHPETRAKASRTAKNLRVLQARKEAASRSSQKGE